LLTDDHLLADIELDREQVTHAVRNGRARAGCGR
jgi:uncharacterized protein YjiS (DUF1127 family)